MKGCSSKVAGGSAVPHCLHDLKTLRNDRNSNFFSDIEPNFYSGEIPIGSDMIHVSGGDAERDFEDDHLAPPKPSCSTID